ncbi:hypothetical protein ACFX13_024443 [Malus domestica]
MDAPEKQEESAAGGSKGLSDRSDLTWLHLEGPSVIYFVFGTPKRVYGPSSTKRQVLRFQRFRIKKGHQRARYQTGTAKESYTQGSMSSKSFQHSFSSGERVQDQRKPEHIFPFALPRGLTGPWAQLNKARIQILHLKKRNKVRILWYGVLQAESSARSLVFEGVGAAFEVRVALVPGRGKRQNNNIEIAYFTL